MSLDDNVNCKEDCFAKLASCILSIAFGIEATKPSVKNVVAEIGDSELVNTLPTFESEVSWIVPIESAEILASLKFFVSAEIRKLAEAAMSSGLLRANSISLEKLLEGLIVISSPSLAVPKRVIVRPSVEIDVKSLPNSFSFKSNAVQAFLVSENTSFIGSGLNKPPPDATAEAVVFPIFVGFWLDTKPTEVNISLPFTPSNVRPFLC